MTSRVDIINTIGQEFLKSNIENGEFSYPQEFKKQAIQYDPIVGNKGREYRHLDLRFVKDDVSVLVETKQDFEKDPTAEEQLSAYVEYEKKLTGNKVVCILANTKNDKIKVWQGSVDLDNYLYEEKELKSMSEYVDLFSYKVNDKETIMANTYLLNEKLFTYGIKEKLRSQFVGTCLLALKNGLEYNNPSFTTKMINAAISEKLSALLDGDANKKQKIDLLDKNVLDSQDIRELKIEYYRDILRFIDEKIMPFFDEQSMYGQDLLNLFFITFNKYVGKDNKNQAFTPDHITDFMSKIIRVDRRSVILDPCCGSGSFLVRAMTIALSDCSTEKQKEEIRKKHIYGIEYDDNIFGLATTNMLIHLDGNSNLVQGSCFDFKDYILKARPNKILMNPPYNAQRMNMPDKYVETWDKSKEDPSKGLYFVKYIADCLNSINQQADLAVLLPVACAIGQKTSISDIKEEILKENTLDAVFSLPAEIFHPGASASVCCMVFKIGTKHESVSNPDTFFGYFKDDGFKKKKKLGRVEQINPITQEGLWASIEKEWIDLYRNRKAVIGKSCNHKVSGDDVWLCEAHMDTDFSTIMKSDFERIVRSYIAFTVQKGVL